MAGYWSDEYSFVDGAVLRSDFIFLAAAESEMQESGVPFTALITWNAGSWGASDVTFDCVGMGISEVPERRIIAVGEYGDVSVFGGGEDYGEKVADGRNAPEARGSLRTLGIIEGRPHVAGMDRQVYRRNGRGDWSCLDDMPAEKGEVVGFEALDGFDAGEIYCVGWKGEIWQYSGEGWDRRESPTNNILTSVCCAANGRVYAAGRRGLLLAGRGPEWRVVENDVKADFWDLAWMGDRLYLATLNGLFALDGETLRVVDFGGDPPRTCHRLATAEGLLLSVGAHDVMLFDGDEWLRVD